MVRGLSYWTLVCFLHTSNSNPENGCFLFTAEEVVHFCTEHTPPSLMYALFERLHDTFARTHTHARRQKDCKTRRKQENTGGFKYAMSL